MAALPVDLVAGITVKRIGATVRVLPVGLVGAGIAEDTVVADVATA